MQLKRIQCTMNLRALFSFVSFSKFARCCCSTLLQHIFGYLIIRPEFNDMLPVPFSPGSQTF